MSSNRINHALDIKKLADAEYAGYEERPTIEHQIEAGKMANSVNAQVAKALRNDVEDTDHDTMIHNLAVAAEALVNVFASHDPGDIREGFLCPFSTSQLVATLTWSAYSKLEDTENRMQQQKDKMREMRRRYVADEISSAQLEKSIQFYRVLEAQADLWRNTYDAMNRVHERFTGNLWSPKDKGAAARKTQTATLAELDALLG